MAKLSADAKTVLDWLRDEYQDDPECADKDVEDIACECELDLQRAAEVLKELDAAGKVTEITHRGLSGSTWYASGAVPRYEWDDEEYPDEESDSAG